MAKIRSRSIKTAQRERESRGRWGLGRHRRKKRRRISKRAAAETAAHPS